MAVMKYIIDKSDLPALIKGEDLALPPKGNIRGFCIEIAGELTNGDMIKAVFPDIKWFINEDGEVFTDHKTLNQKFVRFNLAWWNAQYKRGDEDADSN